MHVIDSLDAWTGQKPVVFVVEAGSVAARQDLLRRLVSRALGVPNTDVAVEHRPNRSPRVVRPESSGLRVSSSSRGGLAALALGTARIGVDLERVEFEAEVPWNVLHPAEADWLRSRPEAERGRDFAQLWSCKEAYLKALGSGLSRDPASIRMVCASSGHASVDDEGEFPMRLQTVWQRRGDISFAVSLAWEADER